MRAIPPPLLLAALCAAGAASPVGAFTALAPTGVPRRAPTSPPADGGRPAFVPARRPAAGDGRGRARRLYAGGFEWEDPAESFDQGVENPYKNPEMLGDGDGMKIDPARLLGPRLQGSNLYFIGMMGSGKSAVGDLVARRMGTYNFLDTDAIIEKASGMTIPEIFEEEGEEGFREVEAQILDSVHSYVRCVISTGGGIVCRMGNWSKLQTGLVIWLDADPEVLMKRIQDDANRPLLRTDDPLQKLKDLLEERKERYGQADLRVEVTEDMDENAVADLVVRKLHDFIDDNPPAWKKAKAKAQAEGLDWVQ